MRILRKRPFTLILASVFLIFLIFNTIGTEEPHNTVNEKNNNAFSEGESITITDQKELKKYAEKNNIPLEIEGQKLIKIESNYEGER